MIALVFYHPFSACADLVYGRVYDKRRTFQPEKDTFLVEDPTGKVVAERVGTNKDGAYSLFLPPGVYRVKFPDGRNATIQSYPEPIRQDIHLK